MIHKSSPSRSSSKTDKSRQSPTLDGAALASSADGRDRQDVDEALKAEYLAALEANVAANRQYDEAVGRSVHFTPSPAANTHDSSTSLLIQHLELRREQNRYAVLVGLRDELDAVKQLSARQAAPDNDVTAAEALVESSGSGHNLESLAQSVSRLIQALELAVVQAHQLSKKERALLNGAKSSLPGSDTVALESRLLALSAVRGELTTWLEQSLDACQEDSPVLPTGGEDEPEAEATDWDAKINGQYELYLAARQKLITAATDLKAPLAENKMERRAGDASSRLPTSTPPRKSGADDLVNAIEVGVLPLLQQNRITHAYLSSVNEQLQKEKTTTANMLDRLSEESQLLPAFPLLSGSERFEHAGSAFGKRRGQVDEGEKDAISKRLVPWLFASNAADIASGGTLQKQVKQSDEAIEAALRDLAELKLLKEDEL